MTDFDENKRIVLQNLNEIIECTENWYEHLRNFVVFVKAATRGQMDVAPSFNDIFDDLITTIEFMRSTASDMSD